MPCLWPRPERGRIIAARPGSAMWIARPVGISCASPGREHERRVEAGAQVEAGAAGGRVGRHLPGDARIEDANVDRCRHAVGQAPRGRRAAISATSWRAERQLVGARQLALAAARRPASARCRRGRRSRARGWRRSAARSCVRQLLARMVRAGRCSRRRSRRRTAASAGARPRRGCRGSRPARSSAPPALRAFLIFASATPATRQSATAAVATKTSLAGAAASIASCISTAVVTSMRRHAARRGQVHRAGDQGDVGAGLGGGACDREAHLAARAVGQAAHRIDRLEGRPGGHQHALAGEQLRLEEGDQRVAQLGGLEHPAVADLAAGLVAAARAEHGRAVGARAGRSCAASPDAPTSRGSSPAPPAAGSARSAAPGRRATAARRRGRGSAWR